MWMSGCRKDCPKAWERYVSTSQEIKQWLHLLAGLQLAKHLKSKLIQRTVSRFTGPCKRYIMTTVSTCYTHTCMEAVNWASFSMVSSPAPLWTLVKTDVLKKYLQFWWSIWYSNSNISALTSGEARYQRQEILLTIFYPGNLMNTNDKKIASEITSLLST